MLRYSTFEFGQFIFSKTLTQISDYSSSLASAEIEILLRIGNRPRFVGFGKIGWARLTETIFVLSIWYMPK